MSHDITPDEPLAAGGSTAMPTASVSDRLERLPFSGFHRNFLLMVTAGEFVETLMLLGLRLAATSFLARGMSGHTHDWSSLGRVPRRPSVQFLEEASRLGRGWVGPVGGVRGGCDQS